MLFWLSSRAAAAVAGEVGERVGLGKIQCPLSSVG